MTAYPRVRPVGDAAATLELGEGIDLDLSARVRALDHALSEAPFPGFLESVPTYRSLFVVYDPRVVAFADVRDALLSLASAPPGAIPPGRLRTIPVRYGSDDGPDLEAVARATGLGPDEVVALHGGHEYTAFMLGFMPGFAYLGQLPEALALPRRPTPRVRVPSGSVGIAGRQTGVYPVASPAGWHILGRTSLVAFDPDAVPPALILPGDRVRFLPVPDLPEPVSAPAAAAAGADPGLEVVEAGLLTTVQDAGRRGHRRLGVGWSGPMDARSLRAANSSVGNPQDAAALECTVTGPTLRFLRTAPFAVTGADLGAVLHRSDLGAWPVPLGSRVLARAGNVLAFTGRRAGCRAYVAVAGGFDVPLVLGSRCTDLAAGFGGFGGRGLRPGDLLPLGAAPGEAPAGASPPPETLGARVRVVLGPQDDLLGEQALALFLSEAWSVGPTSDRLGYRLEGPPLRGPGEIASDGMVPGSIQIPPDGRPIVMMADAPTTGGYPKIATILTADLPLLAQLLPGEGRVRFAAVTVEEAQRMVVAAAGL